MRIISGIYRGRRLSPPTSISARPTTDFAKESLFNLIGNRMDIEGTDMLDLFAGTGGIGFEFVSRGARSVTSVEMAHQQQNFIIATCKQLDIHNLTLIRGDVFRYIRSCQAQYDFIYADPPYDLPLLPTLPDCVLVERSLLKPEGLFVLEHSGSNDFTHHPRFVEHRQYGSVNFSFFR